MEVGAGAALLPAEVTSDWLEGAGRVRGRKRERLDPDPDAEVNPPAAKGRMARCCSSDTIWAL